MEKEGAGCEWERRSGKVAYHMHTNIKGLAVRVSLLGCKEHQPGNPKGGNKRLDNWRMGVETEAK